MLMDILLDAKIKKSAEIIRHAKRVTAFTGAGISVESGIPPFRGAGGLWSKYNPEFLDINFFYTRPAQSWKLIKEIFYDFFGQARPNAAHEVLAWMEEKGFLHAVITQNIDNLHQEAGSRVVHEYHGTSATLVCLECGQKTVARDLRFDPMPPMCPHCGKGVLKPDFVFFGEGIPEPAQSNSMREAHESSVFLVIGTTGEIMPASMIPQYAKRRGATIIEVNLEPSQYTLGTTDIFLRGKATEILSALRQELSADSV